ncbi:TIM-barrel domain-containing protein [Nocardioides sp.]|uniref:TIM-barrel domain-containing protein n=1 Tax=Nocardioides sp. TaxID=35761 RepID=UPI00378323FE
MRRLIVPATGLALVGAALASVPGSSVAAPQQVPAGRQPATARHDLAPSGLRAEVTAPVGGDWSVRFVRGDRTVVATVARDAVAVRTADGRVPADHVVSVDGDTIELGTADPGLSVTAVVEPTDGAYAVRLTGHGEGIEAVSLDLRAPRGERYLGLGERSDRLDHRGRSVLNRVMDGPYRKNQSAALVHLVPPPGLGGRADSTYFPVPWILSTGGYGVLVDDDEDSTFELATAAHPQVNRLSVEADHLDLRVFGGPTPAQVLSRMSTAVGRQPAPTTPALYGVWFQPPDDSVTDVTGQRHRGVPLSVAQTYTHYLPCGSQDTERERAQTSALHALGVSVTTYFNPMVCTKYQPAYGEGLEAGAYTRNLDDSALVYPYWTATHFEVSQIDFSGEAGVDFFHGLLGEAVDDGYDGWMEDFGEYTPRDVVSDDGTPGPAMHNRYVEQYHAAARSFEETAPRPLLRFNRSGWTDAIKESSIVWGGDPTRTWGFDGLSSSVRQGLSMGLSGVSVWGPDIGGFFSLPGDGEPTSELLNRWIEYGAFTGVMRTEADGIHPFTDIPQVTDADVAPTWKRYARLRTMLYPYVAGSQDAYQADGMPLMRHLALVAPHDPQAVRTDSEYLFGSDLLVAPVVRPGQVARKVYLPAGDWIELARAWTVTGDGRITLHRAEVLPGRRTVTAAAPLSTIPLFLRAGAVLPLLPRSVDTLSDYGDEVVHVGDREGQRGLVAAPAPGVHQGTLGTGESLTSQVTSRAWTVSLDAVQARRYAVQATLAGLPESWAPCAVEADGHRTDFRYDRARRVLRFTADVGAQGAVRVLACR